MEKQEFLSLVSERILVLDGATGTNLQASGMPLGVCTESWIIENTETLVNLQKQYIESGSDIIYAPTFGANRSKLSGFGLEDQARGISHDLAVLSKKVVKESGKNVLVAGGISPTGNLIAPLSEITFEETVAVYTDQIIGLIQGEVDLLVIETMLNIQEARAALIAAKETCNLPVIVSMTLEKNGNEQLQYI